MSTNPTTECYLFPELFDRPVLAQFDEPAMTFRVMPGPNLYQAEVVAGTSVSMAWTGAYWLNTTYVVQYVKSDDPNSLTSIPVGSQRIYALQGLEPNTDYVVQVCAQDEWENISPPSNFVSISTTTSQPTDQESASLPTVFALHVTPNPAAGVRPIQVHLTLPKSSPVELSIVDVRGRLVKRLYDGPLDAGNRSLEWNADDSTGRPIANGVYFALVRAPALHPEARVAKIVVGR